MFIHRFLLIYLFNMLDDPASLHSDYQALVKDIVLEQLSHISKTRIQWDEIWCHLIGGCLPATLSSQLRDTIERVSLLYATALRCTNRLSRQELEVRYNGLISRMHDLQLHTPASLYVAEHDDPDTPNSTIRMIKSKAALSECDWIVQEGQAVKGLQWRPVCSVYGTDQIPCSEKILYHVRPSLLAAAWSMLLLHPAQSGHLTTVYDIVQSMHDTKIDRYDNSCAMQVQTELMKWIYVRIGDSHSNTFDAHMQQLLSDTFSRDIYKSIAVRELALYVPIPNVYTAFVVDLVISNIGYVPSCVTKLYAPNATPIERWCIFTRYHMRPVTREALLQNWDTQALIKLQSRNNIYNASTWNTASNIHVAK